MGDIIKLPSRTKPRHAMSRAQADAFLLNAQLEAARELAEIEPSTANRARLLKARLALLEHQDNRQRLLELVEAGVDPEPAA